MKLYATITSERATKGQGGNEYLDIEILEEDRNLIGRLYVHPFWNTVEVEWTNAKGETSFLQKTLIEKGNKQKGESRINDLGQFTDIQ